MRGFSMDSGLSAGSNAFGSEFSAVNCSSPAAATFPEPYALMSFEGWINEPTRTRRTFQSTSSKLLRAKPQDFSLTSVATADSSSHGIVQRSLVDSHAAATQSQLSPTPTPSTSLPLSSPSGTSRLRVPSGFICPLTGRIMRDPVIPVPLLLTQPATQLLSHAGPSNASPPSQLRDAAVQSPVQQKQLSAENESPAAAALAPEAFATRYRLPHGTSGWYERTAISSWLTGQSWNHTLPEPQIQLVANVSLRVAIQDWLKQHGLDYAAADQLLLSLQLEREEPCGQEREGEAEGEDTAAQRGIHSGKERGLPNGEAGPGIWPTISSGTIHVPAHAAAVAAAPAPVPVPVPAREWIWHTAYSLDVATPGLATGVAAAPSDAAAAAATVIQQVPAAHVQQTASPAAPFAATVSAVPSKPPAASAGVGLGATWTWASSRRYDFLSSSVSSSWGSGALGAGGGSWRWRTAGRPPPAPTPTTAAHSAPALDGIGHGLESWGGSMIGGGAAIYGVTTESSTPTPLAARTTYSAVAAMGGTSAFGGNLGPAAAAANSCTLTAAPQQTSTRFASAAETTATVMAVEAVIKAATAAAGLTQAPSGEALAHTEFEAAVATAGLRPSQLKPLVPGRSGGAGVGGAGCRSWHWHGASLYQQHALPRQRSGSKAAVALARAANGGDDISSLCVGSLLASTQVAEGEAERLYHRSLSAPAASPPLKALRQGLPPLSTDTQQLLRPQQTQPQRRHSPQQPSHCRQQPPPVPQPLLCPSREWSAGTGSSPAVATRGDLLRIPLCWVGADAEQLTSAGRGAVDHRAPEPRCHTESQLPPPSLSPPLHQSQPQHQYANQQYLARPGRIGRVCAEPLQPLLPQQQALCQVTGLQRFLEHQATEQKIPDPQYLGDNRYSLTSVPGNLSLTSVPNASQWDTGGGERPIWRRFLSGGSGAMRALLSRLQGQLSGLGSRGTGVMLTGWSDPWGGDDQTGTCGVDALAAVALPSASGSEAMVSAREECLESGSGGVSDSYQSGKGSTDGGSAACGGNIVMNGVDGAGGTGWGGKGRRRAESSYLAMRQAVSCASLNQPKVGSRARVARALSGRREDSGDVGETAGGGGEASISGRWWRPVAADWRRPAVLLAETVGFALDRNLDLDLHNRGKEREHEVVWRKHGYQRNDSESGGDDGVPPSLHLEQQPPPEPSELPLELPLPLQWLTADQLADCGLSPRDEVQAAERQRQRVWRWLQGVPPPACRDLLTLLRCTTLAPQARLTTMAAPTCSSSMATGMGRGLEAAPLRCVPVGSHLPHRITAIAVLPPPPGPPALVYSLPQFRADPLAGDDSVSTTAPCGDGGAAAAGGIPPATSPLTRGSFAILVTRDRPGHVLVEELPSAAATAAVQGPAEASGQSPSPSQPADAATGRGGRCWMVPAVRGRVTVVAACPRGGSLAIGTSAGLVFVWRCFPSESLRALQDVREMEARERPTAAAVEAAVAAAAAGIDTPVEGWSRRPGSSSYADLPLRGSSEAETPLLEWQLCGRLGWPEEAAIGGGGGGGGDGSNDADCSVTALAYDGTGATLFAACRGVVEGWKLRHFEQPERVPSVVTAAFLFLTPEDYGYNYCNAPSDGVVSSSSWFGRSCGSSGAGGGTGGRPVDDTLGSRPNVMPFTSYRNRISGDITRWNGGAVRFSASGSASGSGGLPSALDLGPTAWRPHAMEEEEEEAAVSVAATAPLCIGAATASLPFTSSTALSLPLPSSAAIATATVCTASAPAMASYGTLSSLATSPLRNTASTLSFRVSSAPSEFPPVPSSAPLPCWAGTHAMSITALSQNYPTVCCLAASPSGAHLALALSDGAVHLALHADCPCRTVCVRLLPPSPLPMLADMNQPFPGWATQMAFSGDERRLLVLVLGLGPTRSHRRYRGSAPSRDHPQQRRAGAFEKEFDWGAGGGVSGDGSCDSQQRASRAKAEEGEEDSMGAAEARYSLHCFPLTHEAAAAAAAAEEEEEEEEGAEERVANMEGEFSGAAGNAAAAGLTHGRGGVGAVRTRTDVPGTRVYAALDSQVTDDDEDDDPWVCEVCVLDRDVGEDDDNCDKEPHSDEGVHDEGKDDTGPTAIDDGSRRDGEQGSEDVLEKLKTETFGVLHAKDAVAGLQQQQQQHPLAFPVSTREQCLESSRNVVGGVSFRHQRQLHGVEAPSDVACGGGGSKGSNGRSRSRHRRQRRHCNTPHTTGLCSSGGGGEGNDGTGGRGGGGGGGGCHSEVVLSGLRVPPQSANWRARLTNLVVAADGTSALLLDRSLADMSPGEPGSYCNDNCNCNCQQQSCQQILPKLQKARRDQQQSNVRKHQQRQQLLFVDMTTGRARRLPLELHPCDRSYCCPYHRHHHHLNDHQHQQPLPARGGVAGGPLAVVGSGSAAAGSADKAVMKQNKQRLCCSGYSCSCMALLPGGRELLVGGDCGLFRWTFGA